MEQIKLVLFDLDGVLIDAKEIHYLALNKALGPEFEIQNYQMMLQFQFLDYQRK